jgi:1-acyl-sn-glycerol-3-phosphate acyltransferase
MQKKIKHIAKILFAFSVMTIGGLLGMVLRGMSMGLLTDVNRRHLIPAVCTLILKGLGIRLTGDVIACNPQQPHLLTFNHNSYLDGFVLMALGLTRTRFLLSEKMLPYIPLTLCAWSIGVLFIPQQHHQKRRRMFFVRLEKRLQRENISFAGAAEGVHDFFHGISTFNKGIFHTAMRQQMPIALLFISTPEDSNPFHDFRMFEPGTIHLECLGIVPTDQWKEDELEQRVDGLRQRYVAHFDLTTGGSNENVTTNAKKTDDTARQ